MPGAWVLAPGGMEGVATIPEEPFSDSKEIDPFAISEPRIITGYDHQTLFVPGAAL